MRIVILNNQSEAADFGRNQRQEGDVILPIGPTARHHALMEGWDILTLDSLCTTEEYLKAKAESEQRIKTLLEKLNEYSKSIAKNFPLTIGDYFHFQLHIVIGQIHYNRFILDCIQQKLQPKSWLVFYKSKGSKLFMGFRPNPDSVFQAVFSRSPYAVNGTMIFHGARNKDTDGRSLKQKMSAWLPNSVGIALREVRQKQKIGSFLNSSENKLLLLGAPYDWASLLASAEFKARYSADYVSGQAMQTSKTIDDDLLKILERSITHADSPMFDLSEQSKLINGTLKQMDLHVKKTCEKLKKYRALLSSVFVFPWQNFFGHLANEIEIPVINWQHGEMNLYPDPFTEAVETRYANYYFAYGPGVVPKYEDFIGRSPMQKVFAIGSKGKNIEIENGHCILYATGKWQKTAIPFSNTKDDDTRLYNAQRDILTYLDKIGHKYEVIFKTNNTPGQGEILFNFNNIKIESSKPFTSLLKKAKLVILDTPATTCVETCSTPVPLFVLTGRSPWYKRPKKLLQKRAVLADTTADLIRQIMNYLQDGKYSADTNNTEFLYEYGSGHTAIQANNNALNALNEIIYER